MSSVSAHQDKWWPKSNKHSQAHLPRSGTNPSHSFTSTSHPDPPRKPSAMKFSGLAAAMGFSKPKKAHALPIQQPPPNLTVDTTPTIRHINRPPANSVSTVLSWEDEPQTPPDYGVDNSRVRPHTPKSPHSSNPMLNGRSAIADPNRLSAYSGSPMSDGGKPSLRMFNRASYASTSGTSQFSSANSSTSSLLDPMSDSPSRSNARRTTSSSLKPSGEFGGDVDIYNNPPLEKSGSSSTLTERNAGPAGAARGPSRPSRPRGLTEPTADWGSQSDFLRSPPPPPARTASVPVATQPARTKTLTRQASAARLGPPRAAPPPGTLPPPPLPPTKFSHRDTDKKATHSPAPSSTMSFSTYRASPPRSVNREDEDDLNSRPAHNRTVRKSISHQSFGRRSSSTIHHIPGPSLPDDGERAPRRQRSFYNTAIPRSASPPPIPTHSNHLVSSSPSPIPPTPLASEARRGSFTGSLARKRLFSNASSKHPPSSPGPAIDDDELRSVEIDSMFGIASPSSSASSAIFSSSPDDPPGSPRSSHQQILSPTELLDLEASFDSPEAKLAQRPRVHSFASTSTSISDLYDSPAAPFHYIVDRRATKRCSTATAAPPPVRAPLARPRRPSTAQSVMEKSVFDAAPAAARLSIVTALPGLPLPPRPRSRRQTGVTMESLPFTPLPLAPPPLRRNATSERVPSRGIMRKPSFLDIYDDPPPRPSFAGDSFLDLDRGKDSFDTLR
ncbi:hypothetical protein HWV62_34859 [Athelia sp. TMB]|nr:hypothetical protein HWV62_34859 [Athelia sp. TMB]